jgi:hypothetical protein
VSIELLWRGIGNSIFIPEGRRADPAFASTPLTSGARPSSESGHFWLQLLGYLPYNVLIE